MYYTLESFMRYEGNYDVAEEEYMFALEGLSLETIAAKLQKMFADLIQKITAKVRSMKDGKLKSLLLGLLQRANNGFSKCKALNSQNPELVRKLQEEAQAISNELKSVSGEVSPPKNAKYEGGPGKANPYLTKNSTNQSQNTSSGGSNQSGNAGSTNQSQNTSNRSGNTNTAGSGSSQPKDTTGKSGKVYPGTAPNEPSNPGYDNSSASYAKTVNKATKNRYRSEVHQAANGQFELLRKKLGSSVYNCYGNTKAMRLISKDIRIIHKQFPAVFERHDGESMNMDQSQWTDSYCKKLAAGLRNNFSVTRYRHFLAVHAQINSLGNRLKQKIAEGKNEKENSKSRSRTRRGNKNNPGIIQRSWMANAESFIGYDECDDAAWIYDAMESLSYYDTDNVYAMDDYYYAFEAYELDDADYDVDDDFASESFDVFDEYDFDDFVMENYDDIEFDDFDEYVDESYIDYEFDELTLYEDDSFGQYALY